MDLRNKFIELKKQPLNEQTLNTLKTTLSLTKQVNDRVLSMDILMYLSESMKRLKLYDDSINLLESELSYNYFNQQAEMLRITDDLVRTLLVTEDFQKLKSVLNNRNRYITNEHQKVMQKFYLAVAYEGMKEYKLAIDYLLSIKDNISNANLVNKYLKLAMLYLKTDNLKQAIDNYNLAKTFDPSLKNPIFKLANTDILFKQGKYQVALAEYEAYFIQTKNTHRYLDRYILINIELNNLDEAFSFYKEYLSTMSKVVSKNYRLVFYEAALKLNTILGNQEEINNLKILIDELKPSKPVLNQFDSVYDLLTKSYKNNSYNQLRDILLEMFRNINSMFTFQKLVYISKTNNSTKLYHLSKTLLLEKDLTESQYTNTEVDVFLDEVVDNELFTQTDLQSISKDLYKDNQTKYLFINGIKRQNSFDYFLVYSKDLEDFDFQQKIILISHQLINKQISDFDNYNKNITNYKIYKTLLENSDFGLIKIEKGIIHLLNNYAKTYLNTKNDYIKYEDFQNNLEKPIFIDELLKKNTLNINYEQRSLKLYINEEELSIYIIIQELNKSNSQNYINHLTNLPNEYQLINDFQNTDPITIISIELRNYLDYLKDYNSVGYISEINKLIETTKTSSRTHYLNTYFTGYNNLYLILKTIDKRVIKRITDDLLTNISFDIRLASTKVNHSINKEHIVKLKYLSSLTSKDNKYIQDNKNFRLNQELSKTVLTNINNYLQRKQLPLNYLSVGDWQNKSINMLEVIPSKNSGLLKQSSLSRILNSNNLTIEFDRLLVNSLVKELDTNELNLQILLPISYKTIENIVELKKVIKQITSSKLSNNNFIFKIELSNQMNIDNFLKGLELLKLRNIEVSYYKFIEYININYLPIFKNIKYLYYDMDDLNNEYLNDILKALDNNNLIKILNHSDYTITRSLLLNNNITYLNGSSFPQYNNLNQVKN